METHGFERLIGKDAYIIWDFTCNFFKTKGNGIYLVVSARDNYVQLQKGLTNQFWALCSHIDDAYIPKSEEEEDAEYKSVPLVTDKSVDTTYIEDGKIEPRAFGLNLDLERGDEVIIGPDDNVMVDFSCSGFKFIDSPPLADESPIIKQKEKRSRSETTKSRARLSKPRIKQKDGLFLCHFGIKYVPGIHAIGKGATIEDAYKAWKVASDKMMANKAARKAQKANGG